MIKKFLFYSLGTKNYLRLLHIGFHIAYGANALKNNTVYKYHYFDKYIIRKGDVIIDLGANLGYYTKLFAKWTGETGHVYAVEPVNIYFDVIKWGLKDYKNVTLYNYALGEEEKEITLTSPGDKGFLRTGLTHIPDENETRDAGEYTFQAQMKKGSKLFEPLKKLDFIKCDIEGYEEYVLPELKDLLLRFKPIIQVETFGDQQPKVKTFLTGIGYKIYDVENGKLTSRNDLNTVQYSDLYFIHQDNQSVIDRLKKEQLA
jgi:FkbM family methyltransferase